MKNTKLPASSSEYLGNTRLASCTVVQPQATKPTHVGNVVGLPTTTRLLRWAKNPCKRWKIYIYLVKEPCVFFLGMHMTPNTLFWGILCPSPNVGKLGKSSSQLPLVGDMFVSPGPGRLSQWWRVFPGWRPFEVSMLAWATLTRILWSDLNRQRSPGFWLFYRLGELWLYYPVTERSK